MPYKKHVFSIFNFLGYQTVFLLSIYGEYWAKPWLGLLCSCVFIGIHFRFSKYRKRDFQLLLLTLLIGGLSDCLDVYFGVYTFSREGIFIPFWLFGLWASFSLLLSYSLDWLKRSPLLPVILGAVGGPLAYYLPYKLGIISVGHGFISFCFISVVWATVLLSLVALSKKVS